MMAYRDQFKLGLWVLAALLFLGACATSDTTLGTDPDDSAFNPKIHPAAYGADGFTFRKVQKRRPANTNQFYFKHCSLLDEGSYYSKTNYGCTDH